MPASSRLGHAAFFGIGRLYGGAAGGAWAGASRSAASSRRGAVGGPRRAASRGWLLLRYRGLTLLMLTLATAIMLQELGNERADITGGVDGLTGIDDVPPLLGRFHYDLYGQHRSISIASRYCSSLFLVVRRIVHSPFGRSLTGIRENVRAHARDRLAGAPPAADRLHDSGRASPASPARCSRRRTQFVTLGVLGFDRSAAVLVMLILGGVGRLYGAFIGAAALHDRCRTICAKLEPGLSGSSGSACCWC